MNGYLLDTDHCIKILNGDPIVMKHMATPEELAVGTCVFVEGELIFMALKSDRRESNLIRIGALLDRVRVYSADRESARAYAQLKIGVVQRFGPRARVKRHGFRIETVGLRDNDLWIAALALRYELTLVSADTDFERLAQVGELRLEKWWSPEDGTLSSHGG